MAQPKSQETRGNDSPGLLRTIGQDIKAELSRLGTQGSMEIASVLFAGHSFVPYGPGQQPAERDKSHEHERDLGRDGYER